MFYFVSLLFQAGCVRAPEETQAGLAGEVVASCHPPHFPANAENVGAGGGLPLGLWRRGALLDGIPPRLIWLWPGLRAVTTRGTRAWSGGSGMRRV